MAEDPKLEIPNDLRSFAEKGVDQARVAVDGLFSAAHKALSDAERQMDTAQQSARDLSRTTVDFMETNVAAAFEFAARIARAQSFEEWNRLNSEFVSDQAKRLSDQAKTLGAAGFAASTPPNGKTRGKTGRP